MKRFNYMDLENKIKNRHEELQSLEKAKEMEKELGFVPHRINSKTVVLTKAKKMEALSL